MATDPPANADNETLVYIAPVARFKARETEHYSWSSQAYSPIGTAFTGFKADQYASSGLPSIPPDMLPHKSGSDEKDHHHTLLELQQLSQKQALYESEMVNIGLISGSSLPPSGNKRQSKSQDEQPTQQQQAGKHRKKRSDHPPIPRRTKQLMETKEVTIKGHANDLITGVPTKIARGAGSNMTNDAVCGRLSPHKTSKTKANSHLKHSEPHSRKNSNSALTAAQFRQSRFRPYFNEVRFPNLKPVSQPSKENANQLKSGLTNVKLVQKCGNMQNSPYGKKVKCTYKLIPEGGSVKPDMPPDKSRLSAKQNGSSTVQRTSGHKLSSLQKKSTGSRNVSPTSKNPLEKMPSKGKTNIIKKLKQENSVKEPSPPPPKQSTVETNVEGIQRKRNKMTSQETTEHSKVCKTCVPNKELLDILAVLEQSIADLDSNEEVPTDFEDNDEEIIPKPKMANTCSCKKEVDIKENSKNKEIAKETSDDIKEASKATDTHVAEIPAEKPAVEKEVVVKCEESQEGVKKDVQTKEKERVADEAVPEADDGNEGATPAGAAAGKHVRLNTYRMPTVGAKPRFPVLKDRPKALSEQERKPLIRKTSTQNAAGKKKQLCHTIGKTKYSADRGAVRKNRAGVEKEKSLVGGRVNNPRVMKREPRETQQGKAAACGDEETEEDLDERPLSPVPALRQRSSLVSMLFNYWSDNLADKRHLYNFLAMSTFDKLNNMRTNRVRVRPCGERARFARDLLSLRKMALLRGENTFAREKLREQGETLVDDEELKLYTADDDDDEDDLADLMAELEVRALMVDDEQEEDEFEG